MLKLACCLWMYFKSPLPNYDCCNFLQHAPELVISFLTSILCLGNILSVITGGLDSKLVMWDFSKGRPYKIVDFGIYVLYC